MDKIIFLQSIQGVSFSTSEFARSCEMSLSQAVGVLNRLVKSQVITKVTKGVWANTKHNYYSPYSSIPVLLKNEHGYLSFLSALHRHGILSQIPRTIQIATTGKSRIVQSAVGTFEFFHLNAFMFGDGIEWSQAKAAYLQASPEKALLDTFYLATRKSNRFAKLPELDLENIDIKKFGSSPESVGVKIT
jgi:predicted transcriptional regulator of viral defense system